MAQGEVELQIASEPDAVWSVLGDFGGVASWFPGVDNCRLEDDVRVFDMGGREVREELLDRDELGRALTYWVVSGVPLTSHRATVSVAPADGGSTVRWRFDIEPAEMLPAFHDVYTKALEALAAHVE